MNLIRRLSHVMVWRMPIGCHLSNGVKVKIFILYDYRDVETWGDLPQENVPGPVGDGFECGVVVYSQYDG